MGKLATKQTIVDIEAELNEDGEIDVVFIVDDESDYDGFVFTPDLPSGKTNDTH